MTRDVDRRTVLATTGAGIAMGITGIASGDRTDAGDGTLRPGDTDATAVVTAGVTHRIEDDREDLEVWTVDDIPPYRVRADEGAVAVHGHPERDVLAAFRRSDAVTDLRGHPAAAEARSLGADGSNGVEADAIERPRGGDGPERSIVTDLGPQHRVMERVPTADRYEPPRVAPRIEGSRIALDAEGGDGPTALAAGETVRRALPERRIALRTRDGGSRAVAVTPVLEARHHGRLRIIEERPPGLRDSHAPEGGR